MKYGISNFNVLKQDSLAKVESNEHSIFFSPVSAEEVSATIAEMTKAGGWDGVHSKPLKVVSKCIAGVLAYIFNLSITTGCWTDNSKGSCVVPIYKSGDKLNMSNYRPILLISNL